MIKYYLKWYWKYFKLNFGFWKGMPGALVPTWKDWFGNNWPVSYNKYKMVWEILKDNVRRN